MKTLRVKIPNDQISKSAYHFISIDKCSQIILDYQLDSSITSILINTVEGEEYKLLKTMLSFEYELFKYRYSKFIDSDELFFNLSDFQIS
jgi:hypothetical protein